MTTTEYAAHRRVHRSTIYRWLRLGLPSVTQGRGRRVRVEDANRWLDEGGLSTTTEGGAS